MKLFKIKFVFHKNLSKSYLRQSAEVMILLGPFQLAPHWVKLVPFDNIKTSGQEVFLRDDWFAAVFMFENFENCCD